MSNKRFLGFLLLLGIVIFAEVAGCQDFSPSSPPNGGWNPLLSPDEKWVAFNSSTLHTPNNVWLMDIATKETRQLTFKGGKILGWSPDGTEIFFSTLREGSLRFAAVRASIGASKDNFLSGTTLKGEVATGTPPEQSPLERPLTIFPRDSGDPAWSPGKSKVAFLQSVENGKFQDLTVMDASGTNIKPLTGAFFVRAFKWSPDERKIAFSLGRDVERGLWYYDLDKKALQPIYPGHVNWSYFFSPTGDKLVFGEMGRSPGKMKKKPGSGPSLHFTACSLGKKIASSTMDLEDCDGTVFSWTTAGICFSAKTEKGPRTRMYSPEKKRSTDLPVAEITIKALDFSKDGKGLVYSGFPEKRSDSNLWFTDLEKKVSASLTQTIPSYWSPFQLGDRLVSYVYTGEQTRLFSPDCPLTGTGSFEILNLDYSDPGFLFPTKGDEFIYLNGNRLFQFASGTFSELDVPLMEFTGIQPCFDPASQTLFFLGIKGGQADVFGFEIPSTGRAPSGVFRADPSGKIDRISIGSFSKRLSNVRPDYCPANGKIAFFRESELTTCGRTGSESVLLDLANVLGKGNFFVTSVKWAADGERLIVQVFRKDKSSSGMWDILFGGEKVVHPGSGFSEIYLISAGTGAHVCLFSEKIETEEVLYLQLFSSPAVFFPDGGRVLFTAENNGKHLNLWSCNLTGKDLVQLTQDGGIFPSFDSFGKKILFTSTQGNRETLWRMNYDGTGKEKLFPRP